MSIPTRGSVSLERTLTQVQEAVERRNPHEHLYTRSVRELLTSIRPALLAEPDLAEPGLLHRLCEPERQITFRVSWQDDTGNTHVNRGIRINHNSALGPYKGGLRFDAAVSTDVLKFLAFEQTFKNALTRMNLGGGKGGADFVPKGRSDSEIMRFCQAFMTELARHIGSDTDVPAGDMGVGEREIGFLYGQYKRITNRATAGVLTGKGAEWGGSWCRVQATGYGVVHFLVEMLAARGQSLHGRRVAVSGAGNVALYAVKKATDLGAHVVACSDTSGFLVDETGLDFDALQKIKSNRRQLAEYVDHQPQAVFSNSGSVFEVPCDVFLACATQNELDSRHAAELVANGVKAVVEGANGPCTPGAITVFQQADVLFGPGKAANAGGVAVSAMEMAQNASRSAWTPEEAERALERKMQQIHRECLQTAKQFGSASDYILGANIRGFLLVARAMQAQGLV